MAKIASNVWVERYRPKHVKDIVLPNDFMKFFKDVVSNSFEEGIPNLLLSSPTPGTGKCLDFSEKINIKISEEFYEQHKDLFED